MGGKSGKKKRIRMENGGKWRKERGIISPLLGEIRRNSPIVTKKIEFGGPRCASPVVDYGQTECQVSAIFGEMQHNETIPVDC